MKKLLIYNVLIVLWVSFGNALTFQNDLDEDATFTVRIRWKGSDSFLEAGDKFAKLTKCSIEPGKAESLSLWEIIEYGKKYWTLEMEEMQIVVSAPKVLPIHCKFNDQNLMIDIREDITNEQFKQRITTLDEKTATLSSSDRTWLNAVFIVN